MGKALTTADYENTQRELDQIVQWFEKWQMPFNVDKCEAMYISFRNCNHSYNMQGKSLKTVTEESDLKVTISNDMKSTKHCRSSCKKRQHKARVHRKEL